MRLKKREEEEGGKGERTMIKRNTNKIFRCKGFLNVGEGGGGKGGLRSEGSMRF